MKPLLYELACNPKLISKASRFYGLDEDLVSSERQVFINTTKQYCSSDEISDLSISVNHFHEDAFFWKSSQFWKTCCGLGNHSSYILGSWEIVLLSLSNADILVQYHGSGKIVSLRTHHHELWHSQWYLSKLNKQNNKCVF